MGWVGGEGWGLRSLRVFFLWSWALKFIRLKSSRCGKFLMPDKQTSIVHMLFRVASRRVLVCGHKLPLAAALDTIIR
eukprot:6074865-Amphidinium_carterae.1